MKADATRAPEARSASVANGTVLEPTTEAGRWALPGIVLLGLILRAVPVLGHAWPVGDGGLFYEMVGELKANGLAIPVTTAFDHAGIPFAYPPLALELAALIEMATGVARAQLFVWLPLAFSTLCIPAVYLLGREVLESRPRALFATLVYATVPYAWGWLTLGSGITRSVGVLFALLATWQGVRLLRDGRPWQIVATGILAGLGALSHPEAAAFVAIALGTRLLFERSRRNLASLVLAALVALLVLSPWLVLIVTRFGLAPLLAAAAVTRDPGVSIVLYLFGFLLASPLPAAALLDYLGQARSLVTRRPFLPAWRLAICFLDLRFALVAAVVPLSLLASTGLFDVLIPGLRGALRRLAGRRPHTERGPGAAPPWPWLAGPVTGLAAAAVIVSALVTPSVFLAPHVALSSADLTALTWVRDQQPQDRRFVVLATATWGSDDLSEWFPALSGHASLATSQGLEWVDPAVRRAEGVAESGLRRCQPADLPCLEDWLASNGGPGSGVYVPGAGSAYAAGDDPSAAIRAALLASPAFERLYDGPGADVFVLRG